MTSGEDEQRAAGPVAYHEVVAPPTDPVRAAKARDADDPAHVRIDPEVLRDGGPVRSGGLRTTTGSSAGPGGPAPALPPAPRRLRFEFGHRGEDSDMSGEAYPERRDDPGGGPGSAGPGRAAEQAVGAEAGWLGEAGDTGEYVVQPLEERPEVAAAIEDDVVAPGLSGPAPEGGTPT